MLNLFLSLGQYEVILQHINLNVKIKTIQILKNLNFKIKLGTDGILYEALGLKGKLK